MYVSRVFSLFRRLFWFFSERKYEYRLSRREDMKINIVGPKPEQGWIIYKFAKEMYEQLKQGGYNVSLSTQFDSKADINHFFVPNGIGECIDLSKKYNNATFMITHVDSMYKMDVIKKLTEHGMIGICMSKETRDRMIVNGVKANRVCYVNPAQDGMISPPKIKLGFTHRVYNDFRKKESLILDVCRQIDSSSFKLYIMGEGWEEIVSEIEKLGFEVEYYSQFNKLQYNELILNLDYYCFFGFDEGSMGFLDAQAAGVKTIVTPQGYHLDTGIDITYPVNTLADIVGVLQNLDRERKKHVEFLNEWTWKKYSMKHVEIWKYLFGFDSFENIFENKGRYQDGIFSLLIDDTKYYKSIKERMSEHQNEK